VSVGRLYVFFGKMSVHVSCPFLIGLFVFGVLSSISSLYNWILTLYQICHLQISSPLPFSFVDCFLHCAEAFYFDEVPIVYFFRDMSRKKLLWSMSKRLLTVFSRILMVSCVTFKSLIHLEFIFVYGSIIYNSQIMETAQMSID